MISPPSSGIRCAAWLCLAAAAPAFAAVHTVATGGTAGWTNLQAAINAAASNDEIRIQGGLTLTGSGTELRVTNVLTIGGGWDASFTVQDPTVHGATILNAGNSSRVLSLTARTMLSFVDVTGGNGTGTVASTYGGGIYVDGTAAGSRFTHVKAYTNWAALRGGGIYAAGPVALFACTVHDNTAVSAGGGITLVAASGQSAMLFDSLVFGNSAGNSLWGGNGWFGGGGSFFLVNSTFADSTPGRYGLGITDGARGTAYLRNSIISRNGSGVRNENNNPATWVAGNCILNDGWDTGVTWSYDAGATNPATDPGFVNRTLRNYDHGTNSIALELGGYLLGTTLSGHPVTFVDVNNNGTYEALTDVIVRTGSYGPTAQECLDHYICTTDLAGRPRLSGITGRTIDAGPYQKLRPSKGTVVTFK